MAAPAQVADLDLSAVLERAVAGMLSSQGAQSDQRLVACCEQARTEAEVDACAAAARPAGADRPRRSAAGVC